MWYGGPDRPLGVELDSHGSGAPGRGNVGSKAVVSVVSIDGA